MRQNGTRKRLNRKQQLAVECLTAGNSITHSADVVGVARSTIYRWLNNDYEFQTALDNVRERLRIEADLRITCLLERAIVAVSSAIDDGDARTALAVLKGSGLLPGALPTRGSGVTNTEVNRTWTDIVASLSDENS